MPANDKFWEFKASAKNNKVGELYLYSEIASGSSWWGDEVTPKKFKEELDALGSIDTLNIYVNSPGGDVFAGHAIASMIKRCSAQTVAHVDGLATSMASAIVCACNKVVMPSNTMLMVHHPWTRMVGNANDFRKRAEDLDKIGESTMAIYRAKTGLSDEKLKALLDAESWLTAQEAKELGFCDELEEAVQIAASISGDKLIYNGASFDMKAFKNVPVDKIQSLISGANINQDDPKGGELFKMINEPDFKDKVLGFIQSLFGANTTEPPKALDTNITITKGDDGEVPNEKQTAADISAEIMQRLDALEANNSELLATNKQLTEQNKQLTEQAEQSANEAKTKEFVQKIAAFDKLGINAEELGPVFKSLSESDPEGYAKIEAALQAANEQVAKGALFSEVGADGEGESDIVKRVEAKAKDIQQRDKCTKEQAFTKALRENPELYAEYQKESNGGN